MKKISGRRALFFLLLFFLFLLFSAPFFLRLGMEQWLARGGGVEVHVGRLGLRPLQGGLILRDVRIVREGRQVLTGSVIQLQMALAPLFGQTIRIRNMSLDQVHLDIRVNPDGSLEIASEQITATGRSTRSGTDEGSRGWQVLVDELHVRDSRINLFMGGGELDLEIQDGTLSRLASDPALPAAKLQVQGRVGGAPVSLDLDTVRFTPVLELTGSVAVRDLSLSRLDLFAAGSALPVHGILRAQGPARLLIREDGRVDFSKQGILVLQDAGLAVQGIRGAASLVQWEGDLSLVSDSRFTIELDGTLRGKEVELNMLKSGVRFRDKQLTATGSTSLVFSRGVEVQSSARVELSRPALHLAAGRLDGAGFRWQGGVTYQEAGSPLLELNGSANMDRLGFAVPDADNRGTLQAKKISWQGKTVLHGQEHSGVRLVLDGAAGCGELAWVQPDKAEMNQQSVKLKGRGELIRKQHQQQALFAGSVDLGRSSFSLGSMRWSSESGSWDGTLRQESGQAKLGTGLEGRLELGRFAFSTGTDPFRIRGKTAAMQLDMTFYDASSFAGDASLQGEELHAEQAGSGLDLAVRRLLLDRMHFDDTEAGIGRLEGEEVQAGLPGHKDLFLEIGRLGLAGLQLADFRPGKLTSLQGREIRMLAGPDRKPLVTVTGLEAGELTLAASEGISVSKVSFRDVGLLHTSNGEEGQDGCLLAKIGGDGLAYQAGQGLTGEAVNIGAMECWLKRNRKGRLTVAERLRSLLSTGPADGAAQKDTDTAGPAFSLRKVMVQEESRIHYTDHSLTVPFRSELTISALEIANIDSSRPDQEADFSMKGLLEGRAPLEVQGKVAPFGEQLNLALEIKVKNYPLTNLTPYTVETVGRELDHGRLQLESVLTVQHGNLDMENSLVFSQLETKTVSSDLAARLDSRLPLPLDSAIAFLQDSDEKIVLDIPVSGPLADLHVGISDLLITALGRALVPAATSYLMYTLGPYGALAYVGAKVGEGLLRTRLAPMHFPPGVVQLDEKQKDYCKGLARLLQERPTIDLYICPVVSLAELDTGPGTTSVEDLSALPENARKELIDIGQARAKRVSSFLQEKYGINSERLLICKTRLEAGRDSSRVDLQL